MSEDWRVIEEFPQYSVSSIGRVRHDKLNRYKKQTISPLGYITVCFKNCEGATRCRFLHRLVGCAFIPNPENKPIIDHINRIKTDNRIENLRWVTHTENNYNTDVSSRNRLQEKNIFYDDSHRGKKFVVSMKIEEKNHKAYFETLDEAIIFRDGMLDFYS